MSKRDIYAVYRGEELISTGTAEECAEELNVQPEYVAWLTTPTAKRRLAARKHPEKCVVGVKLEGGNDDGE